MKKQNQKTAGITLIALVITIIIMLILVAVTVTIALTGGLFTQAQKAVSETEIKTADEKAEIIAATAYADKIENPSKSFKDTVEDAIKGTTFEENGVKIEDGNAVIQDKETGREYYITDPGYKLAYKEPLEPVEPPVLRSNNSKWRWWNRCNNNCRLWSNRNSMVRQKK